MTAPSAALTDRPTEPCKCGPRALDALFKSEAFKRGAASVRELVASDLHAQGRIKEADLELQKATELRK